MHREQVAGWCAVHGYGGGSVRDVGSGDEKLSLCTSFLCVMEEDREALND